MSFNPEKLAKLVSKNTAARVGGKGTVRRKAKAVRKTATQDDKKLRTALNKLNLQNIPAIEEVNLFKNDGTVVHFTNPKVQASIPANTYVVSGTPETKKLQDLLPGIINQLAPENLDEIKKMVSQFAPQDKGGLGDDDIPDLVENFETASKPPAPAPKEKKNKPASPKVVPIDEPEPPKEEKAGKKGKKEKAAPKADETPAEKPASPKPASPKPASPKASPAAKPASPKASPKVEATPAPETKDEKPKKGGKKDKPAASPATKAEEAPAEKPASPKASPAAKPASPKPASPAAKPASPKASPKVEATPAPETKDEKPKKTPKKTPAKAEASPAAKATEAPAEPEAEKPKKTPKKTPAKAEASPSSKPEQAPADKPSSPKADPKPAKEKSKKK